MLAFDDDERALFKLEPNGGPNSTRRPDAAFTDPAGETR